MNLKISKSSHAEPLPMDLLLLADPSEEMISRYIHSGEPFVAKIDEKVVGGFILLPISKEEIEIKNIAIYPKFQRKGIGKELIKYAIRTAKMEEYKEIIVKTADTSKNQIAFYQKLKFVHESTIKGHFVKYYKRPIIENGKEAVDQFVFKRTIG